MFNSVEKIYRPQSGSNYLTLGKTCEVLVNRLLGERVRFVMRCDAAPGGDAGSARDILKGPF